MTTAVLATCPWCDAPLAASSERADGCTRCATCGTASLDPQPSPAQLARAYGEWYRPAAGPRFARGGDALLRRTRGALARRVDVLAPPGRVLDVGAGDGVLLDALARRGRPAVGVERESRRSDVIDTALEDLDPPWAAAVFWHALEHLPAPGAAIREAARLLTPGGVLVVAVPNAESLQARAFGARWLHRDPPRHLVHLGTTGLLRGLERSGFAVERVSHLRGGQVVIGWLDGLVGSLPGDRRLYQALRRPDARDAPLHARDRRATLAAAAVLAPIALAAAGIEAALRRGGTVYVEARRV